jgi:hypothetical protein
MTFKVAGQSSNPIGYFSLHTRSMPSNSELERVRKTLGGSWVIYVLSDFFYTVAKPFITLCLSTAIATNYRLALVHLSRAGSALIEVIFVVAQLGALASSLLLFTLNSPAQLCSFRSIDPSA